MSTSRHPIAYRLESLVETGLLIFGGSATMAVILAEMDGSPREQVGSILLLAAIIVPLAAMEAALAKTIESLIDLAVFKRFAALVILAVAAKTASSEVGELLPRPGAIIGLGLLASVSPTGVQLTVRADPILMAKAAAAAGTGIVFALGVALAGPQLRGRVDLDRFRFGSAVALGVLGLSVLELGIVGSEHPVALGVLLVTAIFSYEPGPGTVGTDADSGTDDDNDTEVVASASESPDESPDPVEETGGAGPSVVTDGKGSPADHAGVDGDSPATAAIDPVDDGSAETTVDGNGSANDDGGARAPWL
jgi:hypothetical protein